MKAMDDCIYDWDTYITHCTMVTRFNVILAVIAGINESIVALVMQFVQH